MKILIAPQADNASCSLLARSLISTLSSKDISVAVCHTHSLSRKVPLYPCRSPKRPLFNFGAENRSHEEWMYSRGQMHSGYVLEDTETLLDAIQDYKPDALLCLDRPSALIASRIASIPCIAFVHPAMYRKALFPTHCMHGLNRTLSYYHLEQELSIQDLYDRAVRRIGFGPVALSPFKPELDVTRIGSMDVLSHTVPRTNKLCLFFTEMKQSPAYFEKIIENAYLGAPYSLYVYYPHSRHRTSGNIHYLSHPDLNLLRGSVAFIHDGNDFLFNQAIALGIPQILVANHEYIRIYDALTLKRNHAGIFLDEKEFSMASLYESYRELISDDMYYENTQKLKQELLKEKDIRQITDFIYINVL